MQLSKPRRVSRSHTQTIDATPDRVFPLLCPVREIEWVSGWDPLQVYSSSGVAEQDCVFTTFAAGQESVWVVSSYRPNQHIELIRVTPGVTVCKISAALEPLEATRTSLSLNYTHTSLGPAGDELLSQFSEETWLSFMQRWEQALNHFLATGKRLEA